MRRRNHADGTNPGLGTWRYYHMDAQGSAGLVTDPSHTGTAGGGCSRRRSPTGPTANGTPAPAARWTTNRQRHLAAHRYAQREWNPTVIQYYAPYRWYHPRLSRWTTRDPLGENKAYETVKQCMLKKCAVLPPREKR